MLAQALRDKAFQLVFEKSHFKRGQLDSLLVKRYAKANGLRVKQVLSMKDKPASEGALERSASQARRVISKSVATLVLAVSLGLTDFEVVNSIPRLALVLEQSKVQKPVKEDADRLLGLIDAILERASQK